MKLEVRHLLQLPQLLQVFALFFIHIHLSNFDFILVNGGWSEGDWSKCSVECGTGTQHRVRTCDNPTPSNGGADCEGSVLEVASCTVDYCKSNTSSKIHIVFL